MLLILDAVTVATEQRHLNGGEVRMELARCAMLVAFTMPN